eukprot:6214804-Pleurochrysis_carterae.AAC.2
MGPRSSVSGGDKVSVNQRLTGRGKSSSGKVRGQHMDARAARAPAGRFVWQRASCVLYVCWETESRCGIPMVGWCWASGGRAKKLLYPGEAGRGRRCSQQTGHCT